MSNPMMAYCNYGMEHVVEKYRTCDDWGLSRQNNQKKKLNPKCANSIVACVCLLYGQYGCGVVVPPKRRLRSSAACL